MTIDYEAKYKPLISARSRDRVFKGFIDFDSTDDDAHPNPLYLSGGTPNEGFFPVESMHFNLIDEPFQHLKYKVKGPGTNSFDKNTDEQDHKINDEHTVHSYRYPLNDGQIGINSGFQYSQSDGMPMVKDFSKKLIETLHKPAYDDYKVILTNGSGDSTFKVCDLLCEEGGSILVEEFTFTPTNNTAQDFKTTCIPVKLNIRGDKPAGIDTDYLDDLLTNWSSGPYKHLKKPTALYTIPTGQNPIGLTQSLEVRKKVYALAEKHDFIILEDDPYGYIHFPKFGEPNFYESKDFTNEVYAKSLTPSYLTIDTSGRVIRLDTYSKLFAPGLRVGFLTLNPYFYNRVFLHTCVSTRHPSGVSQLLLNNVINEWGGVDGWLTWSAKVSNEYTKRRDIFIKSLYETKSYQKGQFEVVEPDAGMFVCYYINFERQVPNPDDYEAVLKKLNKKYRKYGVDVVFGNKMTTDLNHPSTKEQSHFIRTTIAAANECSIFVEAAKRISDAHIEFFDELNAGEYDDLIHK